MFFISLTLSCPLLSSSVSEISDRLKFSLLSYQRLLRFALVRKKRDRVFSHFLSIPKVARLTLMVRGKDFSLVFLIGLLVGLFLLPVGENLKLSFWTPTRLHSLWLVFGFGLLALLALWLASVLSRFWPAVFQFAKFAAVGALNTAMDLGLFNLMLILFGFGWFRYSFSLFKAISFVLVVVSSYLWNKFWVFGGKSRKYAREFAVFLLVSVVGLLLNVGLASYVFLRVPPLFGVNETLWANLAAFSAIVVSLLWNFFGYKYLTFRRYT